ncbi:mitochondrial 37S ribosomal protein MRPS35 [Sugiyamaella lignohabitans]|uniref:Mitochondrial 37S ribosomal protein MRPS35 n=1 Tax=Sugiyamaella lignohabitans TaxID=796027 RepID=A0A167E0I7_9ASCO|nr:mitochondrial 37S ribosomal protein MRPS35 [Sugiyamaella lignohabitans]ANB13503.1 mitochondrial 37S ribosomal protein MRPS35 [Sugiyamaella lignohabitans]
MISLQCRKPVSGTMTGIFGQRFASSLRSGQSKKKKATNPRMELNRFLGPKNFKGLYYRNPLAYTPDYAKYSKDANYITAYPIRQEDRMGPAVKWDQVFQSADNRRQYARNIDPLKPFADNPRCKSALLISDALRQSIIDEHNGGLSTQRISFKYKIALPRVEAIIKLYGVEQQFLSQVSINCALINFRSGHLLVYDDF